MIRMAVLEKEHGLCQPFGSRHVLAETIRGVDVERRAARKLNRIFGLKLVELLEKRLPEIGDGHLPFNSDFHVNSLKYII